MSELKKAFSGKRVLVTGHSGFKGAWLCEWLLSLGAQPSGLSINVPTQPSLFEILDLPSRMQHFEGDICSLDTVKKVMETVRPEVVFHLAAQPLVRLSYDVPKSTFDTNVGGTVNVLETLRHNEYTKAAVIITSDKVYENVGWEFAYRENDRLGGKDPYSASKACAEIVISSYLNLFRHEANSVAIGTGRAGNVIGGGDWALDRIVPDCMQAWAAGKIVEIRNPLSVRPWQHVLEPLGGYLHLAAELLKRNPNVMSEAFNFGPAYESCKTVSQLVGSLAQHWPGVKWQEATVPSNQKPEAHVLRVNCDKAYHRLGWQPCLNFESTVKMTSQWYQAFATKSANLKFLTQEQIASYEKALSQSHLQ